MTNRSDYAWIDIVFFDQLPQHILSSRKSSFHFSYFFSRVFISIPIYRV